MTVLVEDVEDVCIIFESVPLLAHMIDHISLRADRNLMHIVVLFMIQIVLYHLHILLKVVMQSDEVFDLLVLLDEEGILGHSLRPSGTHKLSEGDNIKLKVIAEKALHRVLQNVDQILR